MPRILRAYSLMPAAGQLQKLELPAGPELLQRRQCGDDGGHHAHGGFYFVSAHIAENGRLIVTFEEDSPSLVRAPVHFMVIRAGMSPPDGFHLMNAVPTLDGAAPLYLYFQRLVQSEPAYMVLM